MYTIMECFITLLKNSADPDQSAQRASLIWAYKFFPNIKCKYGNFNFTLILGLSAHTEIFPEQYHYPLIQAYTNLAIEVTKLNMEAEVM